MEASTKSSKIMRIIGNKQMRRIKSHKRTKCAQHSQKHNSTMSPLTHLHTRTKSKSNQTHGRNHSHTQKSNQTMSLKHMRATHTQMHQPHHMHAYTLALSGVATRDHAGQPRLGMRRAYFPSTHSTFFFC